MSVRVEGWTVSRRCHSALLVSSPWSVGTFEPVEAMGRRERAARRRDEDDSLALEGLRGWTNPNIYS